MEQPESHAWFRRIEAYELTWCLTFNRVGHRPRVRRFFAIVSRLGDGMFWYALMVGLPLLDGLTGLAVSLRMALVALAGVALYKLLKGRLVRCRPFETHAGICLGTAPLDRYSFPSGHTLHAVAFSLVAVTYYPALGLLLVPFTVLVALSRVVLGLHYPTDVAAGALLGALLAGCGLAF